MSDHSIKGIYEMRLSQDARAIIVSTTNKEDPLKYDYFILSVDPDTSHVDVKKINSPILLAKDSAKSIHRLDSSGDAYKHYADRFASYYNAPKQTAKKLRFKEQAFAPRLMKRNQIKNRT